MAYFKQGKFMMLCGTVTKDATHRVFDSGSKVANFSIRYDTDENQSDENGRKKGLYFDIKVWGSKPLVFDLACCLEKGDIVQVIGVLKKDAKPDRDGNERWYLDAEYINVQQSVQIEESGAEMEEDEAPDDPLPEEFSKTNRYGGEDYPEALQ